MNLRKITLLAVALCALVPAGMARAQGRPGAARNRQDEVQPPSEEEFRKLLEDAGIKKLGEGKYRIGKVTLDARERTVRFPATVRVDAADQIELVVCVPEGKTYETMAVTEAEALHIQIALLLLNMDPGKNPAIDYGPQNPMRRRPDGDLVHVLFEWQPPAPEEAAELPPKRRERVEWFLQDVETRKPFPPAEFVFIGSLWLKGGFAADLDGTVIALYQDPGAVLELSLDRAGSIPWSGVREDRMLENGTEIDVIIADIPKEPEEGPEEDGKKEEKSEQEVPEQQE